MSEEPLGEKIKAARRQRKWSQAQLALKLDIVSLTVHRWEHGESYPSHDLQLKLRDCLGLQPEDFVKTEKRRPSASSVSSALDEALWLDLVYPEAFTPESRADQRIYKGWREPRWPFSSEEKTHTVVLVTDINPSKSVTIDTLSISNPLPFFRFSWLNRESECQAGYDWGNRGEGAKLLAESILADFFHETEEGWREEGKPSRAVMYGLAFRDEIIAQLPGDWCYHQPTPFAPEEWEIAAYEIRNWLLSKFRGTEYEILEEMKKKKEER